VASPRILVNTPCRAHAVRAFRNSGLSNNIGGRSSLAPCRSMTTFLNCPVEDVAELLLAVLLCEPAQGRSMREQ
jgi:hypothetical protein